MTDFYSVLQRAVGSLPDGSGPQRRAVYDKARKALLKQLQSFDPPLPSSEVTAQRLALEDAIRKIENEIARQIRTRRAVQGAIPNSASPRQPGTPLSGSSSLTRPSGPSEAELEAQRQAEAERNREQRSELLASAISTATSNEPDEIRSTVPVPVGPTPAPAESPVAVEEVSFEHIDDEDEFERATSPEVADDVVDADIVADTPEEPAPAATPAVDKKERKARRARKAKREKARRDTSSKPGRAAKRGDGAGRSMVGRLVLPLIMLALLMGAAYAAYLQRDQLMAVIDRLQQPQATSRSPVSGGGPEVIKNTDRLPSTLDGEETRSVTTTPWPPQSDQPVSDEPVRSIEGDDRSEAPAIPAEEQIAALPNDSAQVSETPLPTGDAVANVEGGGTQNAVLYEEAAQAGETGSAASGGVTWSMVRQAIGIGEPEPVVRAEASIPERNLTATVTVREYNEADLSASHLIEIELNLDDEITGGGIKSVPGVIMKQTENSRGDALRGGAARVAQGLFWIALSEAPSDVEANMNLLRTREWIDIPILYENDRRAILTLRKGNDGFDAVDAALRAWDAG